VPTTETTMNQVIHGAVRRDLDRLALALGSFRDGDRDRAAALHRAYDNLRRELTHHHEQEDELIWPMLAGVGVDGQLLASMEAEHHRMADALARSGFAMETFAASATADDAAAARESVEHTRTVVAEHLDHEERDLEPALLPHLESPEWKVVEKKLSRQPPRVAGQFFAWVTDGMTEEHRTYLRSTVPAPVVFVLGRVFGRRYRREVAPVWQSTSA
jgi:hemerythrin-like domain-containing protein